MVSTAADNAWTKILSRSLRRTDEVVLRDMFSETECIERRDLTLVHRIVLGLASADLGQVLDASTAEINDVDSIGRTALSMAVERGDLEAAKLLLQFGADPAICSYSKTSPLHYASTAKDPACISLLLGTGRVVVDCGTDWDQTPLVHAVAFAKDSRHTAILLNCGADPNSRDRDGFTPLGWAAIVNNWEAAEVLLQHGARLENFDLFGTSPLHQCIMSNRHRILELMAPFEPKVSACLPNDLDIWRLIAGNADEMTMRLLGKFDWSGVSALGQHDDGSQIRDLIDKRGDRTEELAVAYDALVLSVSRGTGSPGAESEESDVWVDAYEYL